jgi:hypothetical protein
MRQLMRFLWNATRGHHLAPWRSPYLRWRMETYSGLKMDKIGFVEFWGFLFRERKQLGCFLKWTAEMEKHRGTEAAEKALLQFDGRKRPLVF